jgi:MFS family permease
VNVFDHPNAGHLSTGARRLALISLLAGGFLPPVDFFIINVALPSIHESLGASSAALQLVISGYAAGYAVCLITGGRLGDLYGRRRLFLTGMAVFTLSNLICGIAVSVPQLLIGRIIQGLAAAMIVPQVLASLRALYTEERGLARAMSAYGISMGLAAAIGQFAGGALVEWGPFGLGWRAVFLLKLPICLAVMALAWKVVPETSGRQRVGLDIGGAVLSAVTLAAIVLPLSKGRDLGWPLWVFVVLASVPVLAAWFLWYEDRLARRGGMPLVDVGLLAIPGFRRGVLVGTLFFFTTAFYFLFGIYQQEGRGVAPLQTGLAIVPYGVGLFLGPILTAPLARLRPMLLVIGMSIQVAGYTLIGVLVWLGIATWPLAAAVFVGGFGQGIAFPRLFNVVLADVPAHQGGVAAGIFSSALQVGGAVSAAAVGSLFFSVLGSGTGERAYAHAFAIAQWATSAALFAAMLIAIPRRGRGRRVAMV